MPFNSTHRPLGLGFGENNHFYVRLYEPNQLMINELPFPSKIIEELQNTLAKEITKARFLKDQGKKFTQPKISEILTAVLTNNYHYPEHEIEQMVSMTLALIIPDILVDVNITRLNQYILSDAMKDNKLKSLLAKSLAHLFKFDDQGNINYFVGFGSNKQPIYKSDVAFNYEAMHDEKQKEEAQVSQRFLKSLIVSKYIKDFGIPDSIKAIEAEIKDLKLKENSLQVAIEIKGKEKSIDDWKNTVVAEQLAVVYEDITGNAPKNINWSMIKSKINLQDNDVYAYLVPALLDRMNDKDLQKAAPLLANQLSIADFKLLAIKNYSKLHLTLKPQHANIGNANQRSLQFFPRTTSILENNTLFFRDKHYIFQHTHIHFEKNGEEKEFVIKDNEGNVIHFDGEVHSVFEYTPPEKEGKTNRQKRLIAVHYPLKVVTQDNPDVKELLDVIELTEKKWRQDISDWENRENKADNQPKPQLNLTKQLDFSKLFLNDLNQLSEQNQLLHFPWASWRSKTHAFQSGLRFVVSKKPIEISESQYQALKKIFGEMKKNLSEEEILDPIDRKAGWRKKREQLSLHLADLAQPNIQLYYS